MTTAAVLPPYATGAPHDVLPRMTEEEFVGWCRADVRAEWVDGEVTLMPAIRPDNGKLIVFVTKLVGGFVEEHDLGDLFPEPVHVRLPQQPSRRSPDLFFVASANLGRVHEQEVRGPPDLIIEVVSPESQSRDRRDKFGEYEAAGVREYWMVDQDMRSWQAYGLGADGKYVLLPEQDGVVQSAVLPGLYFRPEWVWQLTPPKVPPLLRDMAELRAKLLASAPPLTGDEP